MRHGKCVSRGILPFFSEYNTDTIFGIDTDISIGYCNIGNIQNNMYNQNTISIYFWSVFNIFHLQTKIEIIFKSYIYCGVLA